MGKIKINYSKGKPNLNIMTRKFMLQLQLRVNPFEFQRSEKKNKNKWELSVGPGSIDLSDCQDGGDNDPEKNWNKHNRYRILRLEFQNLYYPVMDNFEKTWLKDPNALPEEDRAFYVFIIESARNMMDRFEEIEKDFPVTEGSLDSGQNGKNLKSSVLANRMQLLQFIPKTLSPFCEFRRKLREMRAIGTIRAEMEEFVTIETAIMHLVQDLCHLEIDDKNSEL